MQSEELEDSRSSSKETSSATEMTVGLTIEPPSPTLLPPQCSSQLSSPETDFPLDRIKLESYIEKVDPDSPGSTETIEDESNSRGLPAKDSFLDPFKALQEQNPNESIRSWLQRITHMQNEIQKKLTLENDNGSTSNVGRNFGPSVTESGRTGHSSYNNSSTSSTTTHKSSRIVKYEDLPYMGEMTLDNSKPRRGRKPKKADICHLIYKNYGTIFPGAPGVITKDLLEAEGAAKKKSSTSHNNHNNHPTSFGNKTNVQNKIISSLLEKRLTQETRNETTLLTSKLSSKLTVKSDGGGGGDQDEPLNLCIKDLNQLKIRLMKKRHSIAGTTVATTATCTSADSTPEIKSEPQSDDEVEFVNETSSLSSQDTSSLPSSELLALPSDIKGLEDGVAPGGYIYWPNAGVFIHPMALQQHLMYYQRMAANSSYTLPSHSPRPPPESPGSSSKPPQELRKLAPKIRPKKSEDDQDGHEPKVKRNASGCSDKTPAKRKRSAIFIPPIPSENQTNPATEVSICKFKFTGGAKPSLQEKKMLSVDSGGNFRYYSGTGDKSMRGYEFFPRETLQQQVENAHGSSTGAFLQASGEKIYPPPVDFTGKQSHPELMLSPELPTTSLSSVSDLGARHKKRKSRKSLQREKLEQTFKEKGFLIQTQQLESAEGATYCKFRQLRKFTRYLFRSWKDYLPGNVRELQEGETEGGGGGGGGGGEGGGGDGVDGAGIVLPGMEPDMEDLSRLTTTNGLTPSNLSGPL